MTRLDAVYVMSRGPVATDEEIAAAERALGHEIPRAYRELLQVEGNGVRLEAPVVQGADIAVRWFLGVGRGERTIEDARQTYRDVIDRNILPIADLEGGDVLCLDLRREGPPVISWQHERWDDDDPYIDVAVSLEDLIGRLEVPDDILPDPAAAPKWISPRLQRYLDEDAG